MSAALRVVVGAAAVALLVVGAYLGWLCAVALRRGEGVFLPIGYVTAACLAGGGWLLRVAVRG